MSVKSRKRVEDGDSEIWKLWGFRLHCCGNMIQLQLIWLEQRGFVSVMNITACLWGSVAMLYLHCRLGIFSGLRLTCIWFYFIHILGCKGENKEDSLLQFLLISKRSRPQLIAQIQTPWRLKVGPRSEFGHWLLVSLPAFNLSLSAL